MPLASVKVGTSGKTVVASFADGGGAPTAVTALAADASIVVDGGAPVTLAASGALWGPATLGDPTTYVVFPLATAIAPGATVTFSAPSGWASTASGALSASVAVAVTGGSGVSLLPAFESVPKTMPTGFNIVAPSYYASVLQYANAMRHGPGWHVDFGSYALDGSGEVATLSGMISQTIIANATPNGADDRGYPSDPTGTWTLKWDGAGTGVALVHGGGSGTLTQSGETLTGTTDNVRTYLLARDEADVAEKFWSGVVLRATAAGFTNVRVYPPGQPTDGSATFHSDFLRMLAGTRAIRFMDAGACNGSNIIDFADWNQVGQINYSVCPPGRQKAATVASIGPYADATKGLESSPGGWNRHLVTTTAPHGLVTGHCIQFTGMSGPVDLEGGGTFAVGFYGGAIYRVSATEFAVSLYTGGPAPVHTVLSGTVTAEIAPTMPVDDMVALCNAVGADPWINVPHGMTDAGVTAMAEVVAAGLDAGRRVRVEYSNEHWNGSPGFWQYYYCAIMAALDGGGLSRGAWYAKRAGEVHDLFAAALTAEGRAADLIRVFAVQAAWPGGPGPQVVGYLAANAGQIDELALAPYIINEPVSTGAIWDALDVDQIMDLQELAIRGSFHAGMVAAHEAVLHPSFPAAAICCYEGGPERGVGSGTTSILAANSRKWARHPRMRGIILQFLQQLQDGGCSLFVDYTLAYPVADGHLMWGTYHATTQLAGRGDGSDGLFDNRTDYEALDRIVSVEGGALDTWEALFAPTYAHLRLTKPGGGTLALRKIVS